MGTVTFTSFPNRCSADGLGGRHPGPPGSGRPPHHPGPRRQPAGTVTEQRTGLRFARAAWWLWTLASPGGARESVRCPLAGRPSGQSWSRAPRWRRTACPRRAGELFVALVHSVIGWFSIFLSIALFDKNIFRYFFNSFYRGKISVA